MICYIKDFKTYRTIAHYDAVDYSLTDGDPGRVIIYEKDPVQLVTKYAGCWLIASDENIDNTLRPYSYTKSTSESGGAVIDITGSELSSLTRELGTGGLEFRINSLDERHKQYVYYISECTPSDDSLELVLLHPIYAFDRAVLYDQSETYGELIKNILDNDYGTSCSDSAYALTYMTVTNTDATTCVIETDNYGYIIPCEIFEKARQEGVSIEFINTASNQLDVVIKTANYDTGIIVFGDGHSVLHSEAYNASYCAKATVLHELQQQSDVIATSDIKTTTHDNLKVAVQICQDIAGSRSSQKVKLMARLYISWQTLSGGDITFTKNWLWGYLGTSTQGQNVLQARPEWKRTEEEGAIYTDWVYLSDLDDMESCHLYCDVQPNGSSATGPDRLYFSFDVTGIIKSSDIQIGPKMREDEDEESRTLYKVYDYYLTSDGSIVTDPPSARIHGRWNVYEASSTESPFYVALGAFSSNNDNHKIEFYSDKYFEYYQPMKLRLRDEVFYTTVTSRSRNRNDTRYYYKCGNLATTLTDHVKQAEDSEGQKDQEIAQLTSDVEKLKTQGQQNARRYTKSVDDPDPRPAITIPETGYIEITPASSLPADARLQSVSLLYWTGSIGAFNILPYGPSSRRAFIIGTPGLVINNLQCRWWYA